MLFLSVDMIKEAEKRTMENIPSINLIENAAAALYNELKCFNSVRVYCGKGNNGSDGFANALLLKKNGIDTEIVQVAPPNGEDCEYFYRKALEAEIPCLTEISFPSRITLDIAADIS